MLIYNYQKEFLGIDEKDLKKFGLENLGALRAESADFADLFVKKPGYIHNFKHVHWIDFISCAESTEESKAIISVNAQNFKCNISIDHVYLVDHPDSPAYIVHLNNLRVLRDDETHSMSVDSFDRPTPRAEPTPKPKPKAKVVNTPPPPPIQESYTELSIDMDEPLEEITIDDAYDSPAIQKSPEPIPTQTIPQENLDSMLDIGDISLDIEDSFDEQPIVSETPVAAVKPVTPATPKSVPTQAVNDDSPEYVSDYEYDPSIASKELGLPLDLIQEFIQDFIDQAKEFKEGLYNALDTDDIDTIKILSHKLKGVAANLRIEDAHEILSVINTTSDTNVIKRDLSIFYKIVAKLAGEGPVATPAKAEEIAVETIEMTIGTPEPTAQTNEENFNLDIDLDDDDDFTLDFKDDDTEIGTPLDIKDAEVPHKIDLPELADDDFLDNDLSLDVSDAFDDDIKLEIGSDDFKDELPDTEIEYSKTQVANEIGIDLESLNELFEDFVNESHTIFQRINEAVDKGDYASCKNEALKLKGMSDNMRLHEFTTELETLIHSSNKNEIAEAIAKIDKTITKISKIGA